jgi:hypothetical protein
LFWLSKLGMAKAILAQPRLIVHVLLLLVAIPLSTTLV